MRSRSLVLMIAALTVHLPLTVADETRSAGPVFESAVVGAALTRVYCQESDGALIALSDTGPQLDGIVDTVAIVHRRDEPFPHVPDLWIRGVVTESHSITERDGGWSALTFEVAGDGVFFSAQSDPARPFEVRLEPHHAQIAGDVSLVVLHGAFGTFADAAERSWSAFSDVVTQSCESGGESATSCSTTVKLGTPMGGFDIGCGISCQTGYYACCNGAYDCTCEKKSAVGGACRAPSPI